MHLFRHTHNHVSNEWFQISQFFQVKDEKYHRIKGQQILENNNPPPPQVEIGNIVASTKEVQYPDLSKSEESGVNPAFEMNERL